MRINGKLMNKIKTMADYKTLNEIITSHFFLVSVDNNDGTFGYDELLPTKEDCTKYIAEQTHHIITDIKKGIIVVKEYNLSIKDVEWLMNSTLVFFDNISKFDDKCKIIEKIKVGC
jgi:hypothetical protein